MQYKMQFVIWTLFCFFRGFCLADNPIIQTNYTSDPAPMVYNDTVFLYTGHDEDGSTYYTMNDWRVYSSTDMVNWTDRGSPLSYKTFSWASGDAWASQCIYRNGKFYWYVCVKSKSLGRPTIGVAVSPTPTGPFTDALGQPLIANSWDDIDPSVFIDDDGQAYLYWGNPSLYYVKLNDDMISYSGSLNKISMTTASFGTRTGSDRATLYEEGPWFYKREGLYYMVYAAGGIPEYVSYSTSTNSTGPWTYKGVIMPSQGGSFTNHPGLVDFKGKSYFFYHSGALPGGGGYTRSVCVDTFQYNIDGTFPTINMTTQSVKTPVLNLDPYGRVEAETMAFSKGLKVIEDAATGIYVTQIHNGDYIKVRSIGFGSVGADSFLVSVACAGSGGSIELHLDSAAGTNIGSVSVSNTGNATAWKQVQVAVSTVTGVHDLFLLFKGSGTSDLFNIDYWRFIGEGGGGTSSSTSSSSSVSQTAYSSAIIPGTVQMENYDNGGENVAYYDSESGNSGNAYREDDVDIDTADAGASYVLGWLVAGEWTEYTVDISSAGTQPFQARVAAGGDGGSFHLELDGKEITSTVTVPNTSSWSTYQTVEGKTESLSAGTHVLRFVVDGSYFNIDWIHFGTASVSINPVEGSLVRAEKVAYRIFDIHGTYRGKVTASSSLECSSLIRRSYPAGIYVVRAMNGNGVRNIAVIR